MEFLLKKIGIYEIFSSLLLGIIVIITGYYLGLSFIFDNLFVLINLIDNDFIELLLFLSFCYILGTFISELENILEKICIMFDFRSQATKNFLNSSSKVIENKIELERCIIIAKELLNVDKEENFSEDEC